MMKLATISTIVGLVLAVPALGSMSYMVYDLQLDVAANTSYRQIQEWQRLELIRKKRGLDHVEYITWCKLGKDLGVFSVCPPRD
jgi:hypothetical protein